jgi:4'-phosphopantetheinyl transferase EntD
MAMRVVELATQPLPGSVVLAEYDARHAHRLARDAPSLPDEERALAEGIRSAQRRTGFLAGRLALHAALAASADAAHASKPVLRDARGRPLPSWNSPAPISIAHSRIRAVAAVAPRCACAAIGVDVEEIDEHRAHALVRMSLAAEEVERVRADDPALLAGPIALWCAREACVKAHALEVGWFGTALVATAFGPAAPPFADAERGWRVEITLESRAPMVAQAWQSRGAVFAIAVSA